MTNDEEENAVRQLCKEIGYARVAKIAQELCSREGGFFSRLTVEKQKAALEYRGDENHGDPAYQRL